MSMARCASSPDRLSIIHYDGTTVHEVSSTDARTEADTWYTVRISITGGGPENGTVSVERQSDDPGEPVALVVSLPKRPEGDLGPARLHRGRGSEV